MIIKFENKVMRDLQRTMERVTVEVGVLFDATRKVADHGNLKQFNGATGTKVGTKVDVDWAKDVSASMRAQYDYLKKPFTMRSNVDILRLSREFCKYFFGKSTDKRLINMSQAIIRNPILSKKYGHNSGYTQMIKGFDHVMVDTGQFFKSIMARIVKK